MVPDTNLNGTMRKFLFIVVSGMVVLFLGVGSLRAVSKDELHFNQMSISCGPGVDLLVEDSQHHKDGWDTMHVSVNGIGMQEIPGTAASTDEIDDDVTGGQAGDSVQNIVFDELPVSTYRLQLIGLTKETYDCDVSALVKDSQKDAKYSLKGNIDKGQTLCAALHYDPNADPILGKPDLTTKCK